MSANIAQYCRDCVRCKFETPKTGPKVQLQRRYRPLRPNDVVNIDIVGPYPMSSRGMKYVLTMQCDFSKFVCVVPLPDKTSAHVARALTERWLFVFGTPRFVRSDEATDTDAAIVQYVCKMKGIQKIRTPIYSPHANPVERFHQTMNQALRTWIGGTQNKDWDIILPNIVLAYNNFIHSATKYSPSRLFFGREIAPPDIPIIPDEHPALTKYDYLEAIKKGQHIACLIARMNQRKMDTLQKPRQMKRTEMDPEKYEVGDLIQVRNMAPSDKLSSHWEKVFVITRVASNAIRCVRWRIDLHPPYKL